MWFHIGANMDQRERVFIGTMTAQGPRHSGSLRRSGDCNLHLHRIAGQREHLDRGTRRSSEKGFKAALPTSGPTQNRLEYATQGLSVGAENLQASESRIRDTDMAQEMVDFTRNQILIQSGTAMLAQANQKTQSVLQLFQ